MNELIIGLGGNLGSDDQLLARFDDVAADFARRGRVRASRVYRSDALVAGDPPFLNAALAFGTSRAPEALAAYKKAMAADRRAGGTHQGLLRDKIADVAPRAAASYMAKQNYEMAKAAAKTTTAAKTAAKKVGD